MDNKKMKPSGIEWVGDIPSHWETMPNKYVMHKIKHINPIYRGEDILSLTMNGVIVRDLDAGGKMPSSFDGYQKLYQGNLLMCLFDIDVTPRCIGLIKNNGVSSPAYSQFVLHDNAVAAYFYYYYLMVDFTKELLHMAKNLRHSLTEDQLGAISVPVPPVSEQKEIASFLDSKCSEIDSLVADIQSQIDTLDEYKKSVITKAVTTGLNSFVEMKNSGIKWYGNIPKDWDVIKTKYVSNISIGLVTTMTSNYVDDLNEGVPLIRNGDIRMNRIDTNGMVYLSKDFANRNANRKLQNKDIVTVHTGYIGTSAIIKNEFVGSIGFATIQSRPNLDKVNERFLCWLYNSTPFIEQCMYYNTGDGRQNLNLYDFVDLWLTLPSLQEQIQIADFLDTKCEEIDAVIADKKSQLETLEQYKKSLIYEYVTGKKQVKENA